MKTVAELHMKRKSVGSDAGVRVVSGATMRACMNKLSELETDARVGAECIHTSLMAMDQCAAASINAHLDGATTALCALANQSARAKATARRRQSTHNKACVDAAEHTAANVQQLLALEAVMRTHRVPDCVAVDALTMSYTSGVPPLLNLLLLTALADDVPLTFGRISTHPVCVDNCSIVVPQYGKLRPALQNVIFVTLRNGRNEPLSVDICDFVLVLSVAGKDERTKLRVSNTPDAYELAFSLKVGTHKDVETHAVLLLQDVELHAWSFWTYDDGPVLVKCAREDVPARAAPYYTLENEPEPKPAPESSLCTAAEVPIADAAHALQRMRTMVHAYGLATVMQPPCNFGTPVESGTTVLCKALYPDGSESGFAIFVLLSERGTVRFVLCGYASFELMRRFVPILRHAALLPNIMQAHAACPVAVLLCAVPTWHTVQQRLKPLPGTFVANLLSCASRPLCMVRRLLYLSGTPAKAAQLRELPVNARQQLAAALRELRPSLEPEYQRFAYQGLYRLGLVTEDDATHVPPLEMLKLRFAVHQ